jgi:hypothetical protein
MKLRATRKPASVHFSMAWATIDIRGGVDGGTVPSLVCHRRGAAAFLRVHVVADRGSRGRAHPHPWFRIMVGANLSDPRTGPTRRAAGRRSGNSPPSRRPAPTQRAAYARCRRRLRRRLAAIPVPRPPRCCSGPYTRREKSGPKARGLLAQASHRAAEQEPR